ncbi:MAG: PA14 domain-containing protein [Bacteroidota bacterium]
MATYNTEYAQDFNMTAGWDHGKFYRQWRSIPQYSFNVTDIASGYLQFVWIPKRIICSSKALDPPYVLETDIDYSAGSNRGGVVIRAVAYESLQEPDSDPGFNREGVAFYPSADGASMIVQFSGVDMGYGGGTEFVRIAVPRPVGITTLMGRGTLRIEDFGSTIYLYYNGAPYIRIDLEAEGGSNFYSGTVYNSLLQVMGTFAGMEVEVPGKVAVAQRDAALRLYSAALQYNDPTQYDTSTVVKPYRDLYADSWVATDALGRTMPAFDEVGPVKEDKDRVVSIFYITWHTGDHFYNFKSPYAADVSKVLEADPDARLDANHPLWTENSYHWGEPETGYFLSQDEYIIRRDMAMLTQAGVDLLVLDVTNAVLYWDEWEVLFNTMMKIRAEGNKVPQFCFWAFNGPVISVVQYLYDWFYKDPQFEELWFYWEGKPLLLYNGNPDTDAFPGGVQNPNPHYDPAASTDVDHPHYGDPDYTEEFYLDYTQEVKAFFTKRTMWWGYYEWAGERFIGTEDNWSFGYDLGDPRVSSMNPDDLLSTHNGSKEQASVCPAQHPSSLVGKSWRRETGEPELNEYDMPGPAHVPWLDKTVEHPEAYGIYFQDRWDEALASDPPFLFMNDWNEWTAGKYQPDVGTFPFMRRNSPYYFVDQYNAEFNRCVQPMKDGYTDNYYFQMAQNIRKYKGIRPAPALSQLDTITIDGQFGDWERVDHEFRDAAGDTFHRNHRGYGGLHYTDETGRNDIITSKVTYTEQEISFYAQTAQTLTPSTDPNWMLLFIDADRRKETGWEGYDFVVNNGVTSATQTTLKQWDGENWVNEKSISYSVSGDALELAIPRSDLMMEEGTPEFYFHWSDNAQQLENISCFFTDGESAPDRRFDYNFSTSKIETVPQSSYKTLIIPGTIEFEDFDIGGLGVAYSDATIGNSGGLYRPDEMVDIEEKTGGGYNVGWIHTGEWLEYSVDVEAIGTYTATIHYAASDNVNEALFYVNDIEQAGVITLPETGDRQSWSTRAFDLQLLPGRQMIRFFITKASGGLSLDRMEIQAKEVAYPGDGIGLTRTYWTGKAGGRGWFVDSVCSEIDPVVDEAWSDVSPGCDMEKDFWNARWQGEIEPLFSETYTFYLTLNDMGILWIDNQPVIDQWGSSLPGQTFTGTIDLEAGQRVPVQLDFAEMTGEASVKLEWSSPSNLRQVVPQSQLYPLAPTAISETGIKSFAVYPNPATDYLVVRCPGTSVEGIILVDLSGRVVWSDSEPFTGIKTIDLSLDRGIYFVKLRGKGVFPSQKIIIE